MWPRSRVLREEERDGGIEKMTNLVDQMPILLVVVFFLLSAFLRRARAHLVCTRALVPGGNYITKRFGANAGASWRDSKAARWPRSGHL